MKRIIAFLTCVMMLVGIFPQVSFAATTNTELPADAVIAGSKIYTKNYMSNNLNEVNTEIRNNPGRVFYIDRDKNIKDENGNTVTEQQIVNTNIRMLTLYSNQGENKINGTKFVADEGGFFKEIVPNSTITRYGYTILDIQFVEDGNKKAIDVAVKEFNYVPEAHFYFISKENIWNYKKLSEIPGSAELNKRPLTEKFPLVNTGNINDIYICFYNNSGDLVAKGKVENIFGSINGRVVLLYIEPIDNYSSLRLTGNISNNGIAATDGDFIYYSNSADGGKIYRRSIDGYEDYPICNDNAKYINVVGDYIYYSNMSDGGKIYRIKTDGTSRSKINNVLSSYINVVNDDIYYINGKRGSKIYRLKSYNTDPQNEGTLVTTDKASYLVVTDNGKTIYYSNLSDKGRLYSIDTSTGTRKGYSMSNGNTNRGVRYLSISSDGILYASGYDGKLYKLIGEKLYPIIIQTSIVKKGKNSTPQIVTDKVGFINAVNENAIYYRSIADLGRIYKVDSTGTSSKVVDDTATCVNIVDDYVFYLKGSKLYIYDTKLPNKPVAATKFKPEGKVLKVDDLEQIPYGAPLPEKVAVIMDDGSVKDVLVVWDTKNVKGKNGVYTYKGTVIGYGTKVQISAVRYSPMIDEKNIFIFNEEGAKVDSVVVKGLQQGDEVIIYNEDGKIIGKAKADKQGTATLAKIDLDSTGGIIRASRVIAGYAPSTPVVKLYDAEAPSIIKVEYIADNDSYRVTYKGLSDKVSYTIEKIISEENKDNIIKEEIISDQSKDAESVGAGVYYFDFKDDKNNKGISESNIFTKTTKNFILTIKYQNVKTQTTSKPYTLLAQGKPNVIYNLSLGTFSGALNNVEFQVEGMGEWKNSYEINSDRYALLNKTFVVARYKPTGNKLPGEIAYIPLILLPDVAIKTTTSNEDILNTKDNSTYIYDSLNKIFDARYILNKKQSDIKIDVTTSTGILVELKLNGKTISSGSTINKNDIQLNNTIELKVKNSNNVDIATQTFNFRAIDLDLNSPNVTLNGMYVKKAGTSQDPHVAYELKATVPAVVGLGNSLPVIATINPINSGVKDAYNFNYVGDATGGTWQGETISATKYSNGVYLLEVKYNSKDVRPSSIATPTQIYFRILKEEVPVVSILDGSNKKIGIDKTIYIREVKLNNFDASGETNIEWVDDDNSTGTKKYVFYTSYMASDGWKTVKKGDTIYQAKDHILKVAVKNTTNGYIQDFYYYFQVADYNPNLAVRNIEVNLDNRASRTKDVVVANQDTIDLKTYLSKYGDDVKQNTYIDNIKLRFNTVIKEISSVEVELTDKNNQKTSTSRNLNKNIDSDILTLNVSDISTILSSYSLKSLETILNNLYKSPITIKVKVKDYNDVQREFTFNLVF